eukprot:CAMPEP_0119392216 /NCGR_PEP_ID=MMETSP1334-20130426/120328_1 /TAXON_ID=127549 /ORGANISM="Calcidiscus leptoporus, Strain RCC1130" /LENGTH=167 /DNA_ID=CAMNT_0007415035 /DNA_START=180 /DNA_END=679 /DNA_ORIENTATION=-
MLAALVLSGHHLATFLLNDAEMTRLAVYASGSALGFFSLSLGGIEGLAVGALPMPPLWPGALHIALEASSVNPVDWKLLGLPPSLLGLSLPHVIGMDLVGRVVRAQNSSRGFRAGDRVWCLTDIATGSWASVVAFDEARVAKAPLVPGVTPAELASLPAVGLTMYQA